MNAFTTRTETILALVLAVALSATTASGREDIGPGGDKDHNRPEHGGLGNAGAKLADPTSDLGRWPLTDDPAGPAVTVETFAGVRIVKDWADFGFFGIVFEDYDSTVPSIGVRTR